jgi:hypothetical protein
MAYTPFADGTQAFGIPASPLTINAVTYIAEDINLANPTTIVDIKDANGIPSGQNILQGKITGTCKLQLATAATPPPPKGTVFTLFGASYYVTDVGSAYTQGGYTYYNMSFVQKIN